MKKCLLILAIILLSACSSITKEKGVMLKEPVPATKDHLISIALDPVIEYDTKTSLPISVYAVKNGTYKLMCGCNYYSENGYHEVVFETGYKKLLEGKTQSYIIDFAKNSFASDQARCEIRLVDLLEDEYAALSFEVDVL